MLCYYLNEKAPREEAEARGEDPGTVLPRLEVQWQWFPNFIAVDTAIHKRFYAAWTARWSGTLPADILDTDPVAIELNDWILEWVALQYPLFAGLEEYLKGLSEIRQVA
jgi:hypothetical protein